MLAFEQQVGMFILAWGFWFIVLFIFTYFFQKKICKLMEIRVRLLLVGQVSFLCAVGNIIVSMISRS